MARLRRPDAPRSRMRRALRQVRAEERAGDGSDRPFIGARTEVESRSRVRQSRLERRSPTRTVALSFLALIAIGTVLLLLPPMHTNHDQRTHLLTAMFTATSAICVTGLNVVDPATYWTDLGKVTLLVLIQVGGFGIQALGTLWILLLNRRLGARSRMAAMTETGALTPGDVKRVLIALGAVTLIVEATVAGFLTLRFWTAYDYSLGKAAWFGLFHSISAFNNAGFALYSTSLMDLASDPFIILPLSAAIIFGGLGFLVVVEMVSRATGGRGLLPRRHGVVTIDEEMMRNHAREQAILGTYTIAGHPHRQRLRGPIPMSLHTRLMLGGTFALLTIGTAVFALLEWRNPDTLGPMGLGDKLLNAFFSGGVTPRTAGFNSIDYSLVGADTRLLTDGLMFVGGGSGSTAGGIKVTTIIVLLAAALAEVRGNRDVETLDRRIPESTVRVAIAVLLVSGTAVVAATIALITLTGLSLDLALFEIISALATVGLSANVTPTLNPPAQVLLIALMFLGRVGPLTLASSLSLNVIHRNYRLPEGRPMVG
jgi:trk system potassium uptake protein TrkH